MQCGIQQEGAALLRVENSCSGQLSILSLISNLIWSHTKNLHFDVPNKPSKLLCGNLLSSSQRNVLNQLQTMGILIVSHEVNSLNQTAVYGCSRWVWTSQYITDPRMYYSPRPSLLLCFSAFSRVNYSTHNKSYIPAIQLMFYDLKKCRRELYSFLTIDWSHIKLVLHSAWLSMHSFWWGAYSLINMSHLK